MSDDVEHDEVSEAINIALTTGADAVCNGKLSLNIDMLGEILSCFSTRLTPVVIKDDETQETVAIGIGMMTPDNNPLIPLPIAANRLRKLAESLLELAEDQLFREQAEANRQFRLEMAEQRNAALRSMEAADETVAVKPE